MMIELIKLVSDATESEVRSAYNVHGALHSKNEGYGVLAEEMEEVLEQIAIMRRYTDSLVRVIRYDLRELGADLAAIKKSAILTACESIQVAAVAQRFLDLINEVKCDVHLSSGDG